MTSDLNYPGKFRTFVIWTAAVFQVVFVHFVYYSALFLVSYCCSILVTCCNQFDFYLLRFLSNVYDSKFSKVSSLFMVEKDVPAVLKNVISIIVNHFFLRLQISLLYKRRETASQCIIYFYPRKFPDQTYFNSVV
jgi:hypothetical protein